MLSNCSNSQNTPAYVEINDCRQSLDCRGKDQGNT